MSVNLVVLLIAIIALVLSYTDPAKACLDLIIKIFLFFLIDLKLTIKQCKADVILIFLRDGLQIKHNK